MLFLDRIARCSPQQSPLLNKRTCSPGPKDYASPSHEQYVQSGAMFQVDLMTKYLLAFLY